MCVQACIHAHVNLHVGYAHMYLTCAYIAEDCMSSDYTQSASWKEVVSVSFNLYILECNVPYMYIHVMVNAMYKYMHNGE